MSQIDYTKKPLEGRVALVFGAGCCGDDTIGNGEAAALAYANAGAKVVSVDLLIDRAEKTAQIIQSQGGDVIALRADVASNDDVKKVVDDAFAHYGRIDILHNNVGMSPFGDPVTLEEEIWDRCFDVNVKSVFLACKYVLPVMRKQRFGVITNISSILSTRVSEYDLLAYYSSKAAVDHFTRALAVSDGPYGIRANVIQPGLMNTPQIHAHGDIVDLHGSLDDTVQKRDAMSPTLKQGEGWDIGHTAVFLASDAAKYINGVVLPVDGGLTNKQATQPHPVPEDLK